MRFVVALLVVFPVAGCRERRDACIHNFVVQPIPHNWAEWPVVVQGELPKSRPDGRGPEGQNVTLNELRLEDFSVRQRSFDKSTDAEPYIEISQPACSGETLRYSVGTEFVLGGKRTLSLRSSRGNHPNLGIDGKPVPGMASHYGSSYVLSESEPSHAVAAFDLEQNRERPWWQ